MNHTVWWIIFKVSKRELWTENFKNWRLKLLGGWTQDTFPSLAFVCSTCWRCIFPVDCITNFDCTFVCDVLTSLTGHWLCNTILWRCYSLVLLVRASSFQFHRNGYGDWFWGTQSHELCTCSCCIWDTFFEDDSPIMLRFDCDWFRRCLR